MDRIRKRLQRIGPRPDLPRPEATPTPSAGRGGHGDHWGCIVRASEQDELLAYLRHVVQTVEQPEVFEAAGAGVAAHSMGDRLRATVLVVNERLVTAYPEGQEGPIWPITLREAVPWYNGVEGQLTGDCHGAEVSFFDTRFYANRRRYVMGETHDFHMSAFAYTLHPAEDVEVGVDELGGAKVSLRGAHAYMPAASGNPEADIDDYWLHSPLEGEPEAVELAGRQLRLYPVILAIPEHFEMALNVYAAGHSLAPGTSEVAVGEDLEGFMWLQGYLAGSR